MSIQRRPPTGTKLKKGQRPKWVVRYRDHAGHEHSKTFTAEDYDQPYQAAKDYDAAMRDRMRQGTWVDPAQQKVTVGEVYRRWCNRPVRERTRRDYLQTASQLGPLDEVPLLGLTGADVGAWHRQLLTGRPWVGKADTGLAASTAREHVVRLSSAMRMAVDEGLLARNPVKVPADGKVKSVSRSQIPDAAVITRIVAAMRAGGSRYPSKARTPGKPRGTWHEVVRTAAPAPVMADMVLTAVGTGLRLSELCGLVVGNVDFLRREVHVELQVSVAGKQRVALKSEKAERTVPVADDLLAVLGPLCAGKDREAPVFMTGKGTMFRAQSAGAELRKVTNSLALDVPWTFHSFRHYYASLLIASGVPVNGVSRVLGHSDAATTLTVYTHLWPDAADVTRTAIAGAVGACTDSCGTDAGSEGQGNAR